MGHLEILSYSLCDVRFGGGVGHLEILSYSLCDMRFGGGVGHLEILSYSLCDMRVGVAELLVCGSFGDTVLQFV